MTLYMYVVRYCISKSNSKQLGQVTTQGPPLIAFLSGNAFDVDNLPNYHNDHIRGVGGSGRTCYAANMWIVFAGNVIVRRVSWQP